MTRWTRRLLLAAVAVLVPALAGCEAGLDAPTLQYHPANNGANLDVNGISIANAFVLGPPLHATLPPGGRAGVFVAFSAQNGDRLIAVDAPGTARAVRLSSGAVNLPPQAVVSMTGPTPEIVLTGLTSPLAGGTTIDMTFVFARAGAIPLAVPVQPRAYEYATFSPPPRPALSVTPRVTATPAVSPQATPSAGGNQGTNPTASPKATP